MKKERQTVEWREGRRLRAWELRRQGWSQRRIADALGVTQGAVSQWLKRADTGGVTALRSRRATGAPARLTPEQRSKLALILAERPSAAGFAAERWSRPLVRELIKRMYGVEYHVSHISRILQRIEMERRVVQRRRKRTVESRESAELETATPLETRHRSS